MKIINLFGGPGSGKTTFAYYLAYRFKQAGFRAELVGEAAREIIYDRNPPATGGTAAQLIDNQLMITGLQAERIKRLERHGIEIAISDSPLRMGLMYVDDPGMRTALNLAIRRFEEGYPHQLNVRVHRTPGKYDKESRAQTEHEATVLDDKIWEMMQKNPNDYATIWGHEEALFQYLLQEAKHGWN